MEHDGQEQRRSIFARGEELRRHWVVRILRLLAQWAHASLGMAGLVALVLRYGFHMSSDDARAVDALFIMVLDGFILLFGLRLLLAQQPWEFIRSRLVDAIVVVLLLVHVLHPGAVEDVVSLIDPQLNAEAVTALYLVVTQAAILLAFIPSAARASRRLLRLNVQPSAVLVGSFLVFIMVGTGLLLLPKATVEPGLSFIDALFTATSAICVTGLTVVDTATHFTMLGKWILLILIQVGGLGIMTLTTFLGLILGESGNLKEYATVQSMLGEDSIRSIRQTLLTIAVVTFCAEGVGAVVLYESIPSDYPLSNRERIFFAVFHSVSAFCNAGFALTSENLAHPAFASNVPFLSGIMVLVIIGGLGFPVLMSLGRWMWSRLRRMPTRRRISLHARLVIVSTAILLSLGGVAIDMSRDGSSDPLGSMFLSVVARTAGFNTEDIGLLPIPVLLILVGLMWVGGSPASTAGGVKTTSVALAILNLRAIVTGRPRVELFRRTVDRISIVRAFSNILLSIAFIFFLTLVLSVTDRFPLEKVLFEVVSAVGTVGLSTGITPSLSVVGKTVIIVGMFVGRVGFLSFVISLVRRTRVQRVEYQTEHVLVT